MTLILSLMWFIQMFGNRNFKLVGYDTFGSRFGFLTHIYIIIGACNKTAGYELNLWAVDKSFIAPSDGIVMHERQMNNVQLIFYTAGIM